MIEIKKEKDCCGCGACADICPKKCINLLFNENGFLFPKVDKNLCINCQLCNKVCPIYNVRKRRIKNEFYAGQNIDNKIRNRSTSGGIFYAVAKKILDDGGIVYGTALTDNARSAEFRRIDKIEELSALMGSKYIQSKTANVFKLVKQDLNQEKTVLFVGTPCQVEGLKKYINTNFSNLYTMDLVCHGVASQKVWAEYIKYHVKETNKKLIDVNFRSKIIGWNKGGSMQLLFDNDSIYYKDFREDLFGRAFNANLVFRSSCENCCFKGFSRISDITLGDFWGIKEFIKNFDDDLGTSLIIVHSEKGKEILKALSSKLNVSRVKAYEAVKKNPFIVESIKPNKNKEDFFRKLGNEPFEELIEEYAMIEINLWRNLRRKVYRNLIRVWEQIDEYISS